MARQTGQSSELPDETPKLMKPMTTLMTTSPKMKTTKMAIPAVGKDEAAAPVAPMVQRRTELRSKDRCQGQRQAASREQWAAGQGPRLPEKAAGRMAQAVRQGNVPATRRTTTRLLSEQEKTAMIRERMR